jgi:hypothetical protein
VMPIFKDFSKNGELLQIREEPLSEVNLPRYIKTEGIEKAKGYIECLEDFTKQLAECFDTEGKYGGVYRSNSYQVGRQAMTIYEERLEFLNIAKEILKKPDFENVIVINKDLQSLGKEGLNLDSLVQYTKENSMNRVNGYLDALEDVTKVIGSGLNRIVDEKVKKNTLSNIGTQFKLLYENRTEFLKFAKDFLTSDRYESGLNLG